MRWRPARAIRRRSASTTAPPSATFPTQAGRGPWASAWRAEGLAAARVYSSQWCRCLETARLLDLDEVRELPALDSFFNDRSRAEQQTGELRSFLHAAPPSDPLALVTHQVNIRALTGEAIRSAEIVVVALPLGERAVVLGHIPPPE